MFRWTSPTESSFYSSTHQNTAQTKLWISKNYVWTPDTDLGKMTKISAVLQVTMGSVTSIIRKKKKNQNSS